MFFFLYLISDMSQTYRRHPWPLKIVDRIFLLVFLLGGFLLTWYEGFLIMPTYYSELSFIVIIHIVSFFVLISHIYANMILLVLTDTSVRCRTHLPLVSQTWRFCQDCDTHVPARSHHCRNCGVCILRHDHHCWFAGCCIGYRNQRYFCVMLVYMFIMALYCNLFNYAFVCRLKGSLSFFNIISFAMPHVGWVLGYYDAYIFFITTMSAIGFLLLLLFIWSLRNQARQILHGQTQYECKKKITCFNMGFKHNLINVFGPHWFLVFIFPWINSELPGDGFVFQMKNT